MILETLLYPRDMDASRQELYWRKDGKAICFDTYFNMLSIAKWREYTTISRFFLCLEATGKFTVGLFDEDGLLQEYAYVLEKPTVISIPVNARPKSRCVWFAFTPRSEDAHLFTGSWQTDEEPLHKVKLACDICTFKREKYVKANIDLLRKELIDNPTSPLYGNLEIFLIDNGHTLAREDIESEHVHLFQNINAGGSGGFARGLIEINLAKEEMGLTHMVFMDDDATLVPDSLVRTHALLSYVSPAWEKSCVSGAMLREDMPYVSHEAGSHWEGMDPWTPHPGLDLRIRDNVLLNETFDTPDYAAWWFACYPLSVATLDNLPLPLFLHNDDTEYGLRNHNGFMLLNGICVWSPGFENKRASSLSYYDVRNGMIVNALYHEGGNLGMMKKYCQKRILANALRYRYRDAMLVKLAVEDFLKGPRYLMTLDPEEKNRQVMALGYAMKPVEELTDDVLALGEIYGYEPPKKVEDIYDNMHKENKWFYLLTGNGWVFPADKSKPYAYPMGIWPYSLFRKKDVILFDPDTHKGIKGSKDWKQMLACLKAYADIVLMLDKSHAKVMKEYRDSFAYLSGYEGWKEYLKLNDEKN